MSRSGSQDPFYRRLDEATRMGPGVKKILSTPLHYDDSTLNPVAVTEKAAEPAAMKQGLDAPIGNGRLAELANADYAEIEELNQIASELLTMREKYDKPAAPPVAQEPNNIGKIYGTWPGDETDQELLDALSELRGRPPVAEEGAAELEKDQARWQKAIYELLVKETGCTIDAGGCDSGDPLDFTLSEISQAIGILKEENRYLLEDALIWRNRAIGAEEELRENGRGIDLRTGFER